jgi:hypothetical protein
VTNRARHGRFPWSAPNAARRPSARLAEVDYRCTGGLICPAQRVERLRHFVSRHALDIEGLGITHIESFFHDKLLQTPADIFRLTKEELLKRERWAEISASNLIAAIDDKRTPPLDRFLFALGIRHVGAVTARDLARHYSSMDAFLAMIADRDRGAGGDGAGGRRNRREIRRAAGQGAGGDHRHRTGRARSRTGADRFLRRAAQQGSGRRSARPGSGPAGRIRDQGVAGRRARRWCSPASSRR